MKGKYIYGIIKSDNNIRFSSMGLFRKKPYSISYNGISAVVKDAPVKIYEADQKGLLSHNSVLSEIMKNTSVLPLSYGTIAKSEDEVKGLLKNAYPVIVEKLAKIKDKAEFDMEVTVVNEQPILNEILEKNKEIKALRNNLLAQGKEAKIQDKLLIGSMIAKEVVRYKLDAAKEIMAWLNPYCSEHKVIGGTPFLLNSVFLVYKPKMKDFESAIYKLGDKYGDRLKFKYAGPLAPYSFVELKLLMINFNTIDNARKQLGLSEEAALKDIKDAYRNLAQEYHPDKNSGDTVKEEEFKKIADAYKLLYEYTKRYPRNRYIFKPKEVTEFSILLKETGHDE